MDFSGQNLSENKNTGQIFLKGSNSPAFKRVASDDSDTNSFRSILGCSSKISESLCKPEEPQPPIKQISETFQIFPLIPAQTVHLKSFHSEKGCPAPVNSLDRTSLTNFSERNKNCHNEDLPALPSQFSRALLKEDLTPCGDREFAGLKGLLRDYLYFGLSSAKDYNLTDSELRIFKFLLKKKFIFSQSSPFERGLERLERDSVVPFLLKFPMKKRTHLYKKMIFIKFWKFLEISGSNVLKDFFSNTPELNYRRVMSSKKGNLFNDFYQKCLNFQEFRAEFRKTILSKQFWNFCNLKSLKSFEANFEKWVSKISSFLQGPYEKEKEKLILLQIKFMSVDLNPKRVFKLFKLSE